jgi:hypothetical protein
MSRISKKIAQNITAMPKPIETKSIKLKYILGCTSSTTGVVSNCSVFMQLDDIPKDLPEEMEAELIKFAPKQLMQALNKSKYLDTYSEDCDDPRDEKPQFINLDLLTSIAVDKIIKV